MLSQGQLPEAFSDLFQPPTCERERERERERKEALNAWRRKSPQGKLVLSTLTDLVSALTHYAWNNREASKTRLKARGINRSPWTMMDWVMASCDVTGGEAGRCVFRQPQLRKIPSEEDEQAGSLYSATSSLGTAKVRYLFTSVEFLP